MTAPAIVRELERDGAPLPPRCSKRRKEQVHALMSNETYRGTYWYDKSSWVTTEEGTKVTRNPKDTWIGAPFPPLVDEKTWERVRARKFKRFSHSKRNTKTFYLLQHTVKCAECGLYLGGRAVTSNCQKQNGKRYLCKVNPPRRCYRCFRMSVHKLECRRPGFIKAERLEEFTDVPLLVALIENSCGNEPLCSGKRHQPSSPAPLQRRPCSRRRGTRAGTRTIWDRGRWRRGWDSNPR